MWPCASFAFLWLAAGATRASAERASGLYSPSDAGIISLNSTNLKTSVLASETAWMVEFYSSWCGHCVHFAPTFKELAKDVKGIEDL